MFSCPRCTAPLTDVQQSEGRCPLCGAVWDAVAPAGRTIDLPDGADLGQTFEFDLVDESTDKPAEQSQSPDHLPADTKANEEYGGTIEIDMPESAEAEDGMQTIDLPSAEPPPIPPRSILDSPEASLLKGTQASEEEFEFTLSEDASPGEQGDASKIDRTIDLPPPSSEPGGTIDLPDNLFAQQNTLDLPPEGLQPFDQTMELPGDGPGRTLDLPPADGIGQTVESVGGDNSAFELKVGSQPLSSDGVRKYWEGADQPGDTPYTSLKSATVAKGRELGVEIRERILAKNAKPGASSDYELVSVLGEGGMGTVYAADQKSVRRRVAIKTLKSRGGKRKDDRAKFLSEAVLTGFLDHPNIVPIHELGQTGDGTLFYSMKLVSGTPWHEAIRGKTEHENLEYLDRVCDAVAFAHSRGVIHRDLKPENVMLGEFGEVLVMDWGLAVDLNRGDHFSMGGTPAYMAPEMVRGPIELIGIGSDIYLLGAILFEIVTGAPPHAAKTVTECLVAAAENKISYVESNNTLLKIALRAMSSEIEDRYVSVAQFQMAIREYQFHSQSLGLAARAKEDLEQAQATQNYEQFSRSLFGYQDAIELWPKNEAALVGFQEARRAYAQCALAKADFDLGLQQLDENDPETRSLYDALVRGRRDRRLAQSRKRFAQLSAIAAMLLLMIGAVAFGVVVYGKNAAIAKERDRAEVQRQLAETNAQRAKENEEVALIAKDEAVQAKDAAVIAKLAADKAKEEAEEAQKLELEQRTLAEKNAAAAQRSADVAEAARQEANERRAEAEFAAVFSRIGLAQAKIEANDIGRAIELLEQIPPRFRNWEWGHLYERCHADVPQIDAQRPITAVAVSPRSDVTAVGGSDGIVSLYSQAGGALAQKTFDMHGAAITSLAFAPSGEYLLIGSDDPQQLVAWYPATDEKIAIDVENPYIPNQQGQRYRIERIAFEPTTGAAYVAASGYLFALASPNAKAKPLRYFSDGLNAVRPAWDGASLLLAGGNMRRGRLETVQFDTLTTSAEATLSEIPIAACWIAPGVAAVATSDGAMSTWTPGESETLEFDRLNARVNTLDYNPQSQLLAAAMEDGSICVWSVGETASQPTRGKTLRGHLDVVSSAQWSQNGKTLISGSVDQHLRYWDYESYRDQLTIDHDSSVLSVAYSSDGRLAATGDSGGGVRIFQPDQLNGGDVFYLREGDWLAESRATEFGAQFVGPNHLVTQIGGVNAAVWQLDSTRLVDSFPIGGQSVAIAAAPDGQRYALQDGEASLLRIRDFAGQETTIAQPAKAWGLDFSPSGNQIAVAKLVMASIYATSPADDPLIWKRAVNGVKQIAFLDESVVAVGGARGTDGGVMLLEVGTGRRLGDFSAEEGESYQSFVLSPDRSRIAALFRIGEEAEHRIKVWHTNSELLASASITDEVRSLGFTADGYLLLAGDHDVLLWNLNDKPQSIPGIAAAAKQSGRKIGGAVASPQNGDELAVYYENRDVEIWNASAGRRQRLNSARPVVYVGFSKDDTEVVAVHRDGLVRRWNAGDGSKIGQWTTRCNHVTSAALRDDRLVIAGDDGEVTMINWKTGKPTAKTKLDSAALDLAWTDQRIIAACGDGRLRLLSGENVQPVGQPFGEHGGSYLGVAIDSDEQRLAAVSSDRKVRVWLEVDLTAEKVGEPLVHEGHSAAVNSVAFSTDGRRLVTGSSDSMVIVWYVDRPETDQPVLMREIMPLRGHQKGITAIKFSPQTTDLMTAGDDGRATVWFGVDWKKEQNAPQPTAAAEQEP